MEDLQFLNTHFTEFQYVLFEHCTTVRENILFDQFEFYFKDDEVIHDAAHLILVALEADRSTYNSGEQEKIATFLKDFVPVFFDLDRTKFIEFMSDIYGNGPGGGDLEDGAASDEASTSKIRMSNLRKSG